MVIQPHKIYKIKTKKGEFIGQLVGEKIQSKVFKDQSGKRIEIENEDIKSFEMIKDMTDVPHSSHDRDTKLKNIGRGHMNMLPTYKQ